MPPPTPTFFSKKVFPLRGGWILKQIRREPVLQFPLHQKVFDAWGVDYETGPFTYCSLCPPQQTGGGEIWNRLLWDLFHNPPPTKKASTHGGWIMKQVSKQTVSEIPPQRSLKVWKTYSNKASCNSFCHRILFLLPFKSTFVGHCVM